MFDCCICQYPFSDMSVGLVMRHYVVWSAYWTQRWQLMISITYLEIFPVSQVRYIPFWPFFLGWRNSSVFSCVNSVCPTITLTGLSIICAAIFMSTQQYSTSNTQQSMSNHLRWYPCYHEQHCFCCCCSCCAADCYSCVCPPIWYTHTSWEEGNKEEEEGRDELQKNVSVRYGHPTTVLEPKQSLQEVLLD